MLYLRHQYATCTNVVFLKSMIQPASKNELTTRRNHWIILTHIYQISKRNPMISGYLLKRWNNTCINSKTIPSL
ncbi:hypothetical protein C447_01200 [Halococcus hamelinensis 100A6]|uniref:Uncharacterized protein n=1 Tax=Halococcus hamelinensis 100A6 TaxID=1132509 RepID=M0M7T3_9EURY|nr:hypothetical protein C447_01200 [Halococcus hamelinensis 100A6]